MSYVSGTLNSVADILAQFKSCASAAGWTVDEDDISKGGYTLTASLKTYLPATLDIDYLEFQGTCNADSSKSEIFRMIPPDAAGFEMDWPIFYECFYFTDPDEVYFTFRYHSHYYQRICFGNSPAEGVSSCFWFSAPFRGVVSPGSSSVGEVNYISTKSVFTARGSNSRLQPGLFCTEGCFYNALDNRWCNQTSGTAADSHNGNQYLASLLHAAPSPFTSSPSLYPIKLIGSRTTSGAYTIMGWLRNARVLRMDYLTPGQIVTYGNDKWKMQPHYRFNPDEPLSGNQSTHSGSFGFAFRDDRP